MTGGDLELSLRHAREAEVGSFHCECWQRILTYLRNLI